MMSAIDESAYCVSAGGLQAVVGRLSVGPAGLEALASEPRWAAAEALAHRRMLSMVEGLGPAIAFDFLTVFRCEDGLTAMLWFFSEELSLVLGQGRPHHGGVDVQDGYRN